MISVTAETGGYLIIYNLDDYSTTSSSRVYPKNYYQGRRNVSESTIIIDTTSPVCSDPYLTTDAAYTNQVGVT